MDKLIILGLAFAVGISALNIREAEVSNPIHSKQESLVNKMGRQGNSTLAAIETISGGILNEGVAIGAGQATTVAVYLTNVTNSIQNITITSGR